MKNNDFIEVLEDCNAHLIPSGDAIKLKKGTRAKITQLLEEILLYMLTEI